VPKIIINDTIRFFSISILVTRTTTVSECCLIKLLPYIFFEKYMDILALEMASPGNRHCANCIGALSFPISVREWWSVDTMLRARAHPTRARCCAAPGCGVNASSEWKHTYNRYNTLGEVTSQNVRSPCCRYNFAWCVELKGEYLWRYLHKIGSVSLRKCPYHYTVFKRCYTKQHFKNYTYKMAANTIWHRYGTQLRHFYPTGWRKKVGDTNLWPFFCQILTY